MKRPTCVCVFVSDNIVEWQKVWFRWIYVLSTFCMLVGVNFSIVEHLTRNDMRWQNTGCFVMYLLSKGFLVNLLYSYIICLGLTLASFFVCMCVSSFGISIVGYFPCSTLFCFFSPVIRILQVEWLWLCESQNNLTRYAKRLENKMKCKDVSNRCQV